MDFQNQRSIWKGNTAPSLLVNEPIFQDNQTTLPSFKQYHTLTKIDELKYVWMNSELRKNRNEGNFSIETGQNPQIDFLFNRKIPTRCILAFYQRNSVLKPIEEIFRWSGSSASFCDRRAIFRHLDPTWPYSRYILLTYETSFLIPSYRERDPRDSRSFVNCHNCSTLQAGTVWEKSIKINSHYLVCINESWWNQRFPS